MGIYLDEIPDAMLDRLVALHRKLMDKDFTADVQRDPQSFGFLLRVKGYHDCGRPFFAEYRVKAVGLDTPDPDGRKAAEEFMESLRSAPCEDCETPGEQAPDLADLNWTQADDDAYWDMERDFHQEVVKGVRWYYRKDNGECADFVSSADKETLGNGNWNVQLRGWLNAPPGGVIAGLLLGGPEPVNADGLPLWVWKQDLDAMPADLLP